MTREYEICSKCVSDTISTTITFDRDGVCSLCRRYAKQLKHMSDSGEYSEEKLNLRIDEIKKQGADKKFDCVLGISGGVDSSYLAYLCHKFKLRPLCVHFDNGWNSELAVKNIERIIKKFKFSLYTYVIDWEEFKDLQISFFKASVVDIELLTDHAIFSVLYKIANANDIMFILSGGNVATEFTMPNNWNHHKFDALNIYAIQNQFGTKKIANYPLIDPYSLWKYRQKGIKFFEPLNYRDYIINEVTSILEKEIGWKYYGWKHFESVFTRFYQGYFLPEKFKIDKRKIHLSNLIWSNQITRKEALGILSNASYDTDQRRSDKEFVLKKLGLFENDFDKIMALPTKSHFDYGSLFQPRQ